MAAHVPRCFRRTFGRERGLLSACGGASDDQNVTETPSRRTVENFRDVAGAGDGYPTVDGGSLRRGVFYRSGALTPDDADAAALARLPLSAVHDLRAVGEASLAPDRVPSGAVRETHEIAPIDVAAAAPADAAAASAWIVERQRQLVTDPVARLQFGALLTRLARVSGPQVIHGTAGKDRTGWAAALLLSIADVPLDVIIQDYLLTNSVAQPQIAARMKRMRRALGTDTRTVAPLYQAQSATHRSGVRRDASRVRHAEPLSRAGLVDDQRGCGDVAGEVDCVGSSFRLLTHAPGTPRISMSSRFPD